jgi:hypothetical protein
MYCEKSEENEHFACEVCGVGMCDDCYHQDIDHINHYHEILENCDDDREIELITKACGGTEPAYICENCVYEILNNGKS